MRGKPAEVKAAWAGDSIHLRTLRAYVYLFIAGCVELGMHMNARAHAQVRDGSCMSQLRYFIAESLAVNKSAAAAVVTWQCLTNLDGTKIKLQATSGLTAVWPANPTTTFSVLGLIKQHFISLTPKS
jgi:hypothetical protein